MGWESQVSQPTYPSGVSIVRKSSRTIASCKCAFRSHPLGAATLLDARHITNSPHAAGLDDRPLGRAMPSFRSVCAGRWPDHQFTRRRRRWRSTPLVGRGAVKRSLPDRDNWTLSPPRGVERPLGRSPDDGDTARSGLRGRSLQTCCPLGRASSVQVDWLNASQFWRDCRRARTAGSSSAWGQTSLPCRRLRAGALRIRSTPLNAATRICRCAMKCTHQCLQSEGLQDHAAEHGSITFLSLPLFFAHIV